MSTQGPHSTMVTVGYDGSQTTRRALLWAAAEAKSSGASLRPVTAMGASRMRPRRRKRGKDSSN